MFYRKRLSDSTRGLSYFRRQLSQLMYHNTGYLDYFFGHRKRKALLRSISSLQNVYIEVNGHSRLDSLLGGFYTLYASPELRGVRLSVKEWADLNISPSLQHERSADFGNAGRRRKIESAMFGQYR